MIKVIKLIVLGCVFLFLLFVLVGTLGYNYFKNNELSQPSEVFDSKGVEPKKKIETARKNWTYSNEVVGIDKKKMYFITNVSTNSLDLKFPYSGNNKGFLTLRKSDAKTELLFSLEKGQILCDLYKCNGRIKFDSSTSIPFSGSKPSDGSSKTIFFDNSKELIEKIKNSQNVTIEVEMFQEGKQLLEFRVGDLDFTYLKN